MDHEFVLLVHGELKTYTRFEDLPEEFDRVIKFLPAVPQPPHTPEQHEEIERWGERLLELIKAEEG